MSETNEDEAAALEAAVAKYGSGDEIGRWGPVQAHQGRTVGEPCLAGLDLCDDYDVDTWLTEAKSWIKYAKALRDDNVVYQFGTDPSQWPPTARHGEHAYQRAREIVGGELGFFDRTNVETLQSAQRYAKVALELYVRAIEADLGTTVDADKYKGLTHDTVAEPTDTPPVIPPPKLPSLPPLGTLLKIAGGAAVGLVALGITANMWRT